MDNAVFDLLSVGYKQHNWLYNGILATPEGKTYSNVVINARFLDFLTQWQNSFIKIKFFKIFINSAFNAML